MRLGSRYPGISGSLESSNASSESTTGVPNKHYRGAQQGSPSGGWPLPPVLCTNKPKTRPTRPCDTPPATYRGAQQKVPGCPTKSTGVPDKWLSPKLLQNRVFHVVFRRPFVFVSLVVL